MSCNLSSLLNHTATWTTTSNTAIFNEISLYLKQIPSLVPVVDVAEGGTADGSYTGAHLALPGHLLFDCSLGTRHKEANAQ